MSTLGKIASSVFGTTPDEKLATTDIYAKDPNTKSLTSIADLTSSLSKEVVNAGLWLGSSSGIMSIIGSLKSSGSGKVTLDPKELTKRLLDASGGGSSPILDIADSTRKRLLSTMGLPEDITSVNDFKNKINQAGQNLRENLGNTVLFNDITTIIDSAEKIKDTQDVVSLLNTVIGSEVTKAVFGDTLSKFTILKDVIGQASRLGLPDVLDSVLDNISSEEDKRKLLIDSLESLVSYSDMVGIRTVITQAGKGAILSRSPSVINNILKSYKLAPTVDATQYVAKSNELIGILNDIDVRWYQYDRNGTWITKLDAMSGISTDAKTMLMINNTYKPLVMMADSYPSSVLIDTLKKQYPYSGL